MKNILFVPVPSSWYGKRWGEVMTFNEAVKALDSDEQKQAVMLMREIDMQLGIEAELSSSINDSPDGANVVIIHDIKTTLDRETLRYIAAVKGKVLLDESPNPSLPRKVAITRVYEIDEHTYSIVILGVRGSAL